MNRRISFHFAAILVIYDYVKINKYAISAGRYDLNVMGDITFIYYVSVDLQIMRTITNHS